MKIRDRDPSFTMDFNNLETEFATWGLEDSSLHLKVFLLEEARKFAIWTWGFIVGKFARVPLYENGLCCQMISWDGCIDVGFRKGSGMTYLERGYVRYLCEVHLGEETNYGLLWCTPCFARFTHKLLQGIDLCPRNCSEAPLLVGNADTGHKHGKIGHDFS